MTLFSNCERTVTSLSSFSRRITLLAPSHVVWIGDSLVNVAATLRRQFAYDAWANQEVVKAIRRAGGDNARSLQLMSHILAAERVWFDRLKQQPQRAPVWPESNLPQCESEAESLERIWLEYLNTLSDADIGNTVSYKNTKGENWKSTVFDILSHVVMHSAYHRGQIASHMRASGQTPAYTDYIHAIRQGFVK
jgi:uncharacterized damage-inducible protein DinB